MKLFIVSVPSSQITGQRVLHLVQAQDKNSCKRLVRKTDFNTPFNRYNEIGSAKDTTRERVVI